MASWNGHDQQLKRISLAYTLAESEVLPALYALVLTEYARYLSTIGMPQPLVPLPDCWLKKALLIF